MADAQEELSHVEQVMAWLDENVLVFKDVRKVTMHSFDIDMEKLSGRFNLRLDDTEIEMPFSFSCFTLTGKTKVYPPIYTSPLGAPASYSAVELPNGLIEKIESALNEYTPKFKPLGLDKTNGKILITQSPVQDRLYPDTNLLTLRNVFTKPSFAIQFDCD